MEKVDGWEYKFQIGCIGLDVKGIRGEDSLELASLGEAVFPRLKRPQKWSIEKQEEQKISLSVFFARGIFLLSCLCLSKC